MSDSPFVAPISQHIWDTKYRYRDGDRIVDVRIEDTWRRIARALATVEPTEPGRWEERFYRALEGFRFLPGGRIQAGAGTGKEVTLFNCFVMGPIEDSLDGIFNGLKEGALTMQQGGRVGYDFSTLRPRGTPARRTGAVASGPVSFMRIWDSMCGTLLSTGSRRGAMMATLRCDHPDIEEFIQAKADPRELRNFNLSVQVTDAFIRAVEENAAWPLVFPSGELGRGKATRPDGEILIRDWPGSPRPVPCRIVRTLPARELWQRIVRASYDFAEPGVLFVDRINQGNNLWYRERISATNPCGEVPLPAYGACDLAAINLTDFVRDPFAPGAHLDLDGLVGLVPLAVRMLDNVIDASRFPLRRQEEQAQGTRRIGLGVTGLGDALLMLGLPYDAEAARELAARTLRTLCHEAYRASIAIAGEKGSFPFLDRRRYLEGRFVQRLPKDIRQGIALHGIRNSHLISIAPTGTISLLANNISSGIEPVFDFHFSRRVRGADGCDQVFDLEDYALRRWRQHAGNQAPVPLWFAGARELPAEAHLKMQAALQPYVDNAISKTINVPQSLPISDFESIYLTAFRLDLKGCTVFRPNPVTGAVLSVDDSARAPHCCSVDREGA